MRKFAKLIMSIAVLVFGITMYGTNAMAEEVSNAELITVDLVIFAGQSNMSGVGGDVDEAPSVPNGTGFEFRNGQDPMGLYEVTEPFGERANGYLSDPAGLRNGTLVSSFMSTYYNVTGVPVLAISAARGGSALSDFWSTAEVKSEFLAKYQAAKDWCSQNNVKIRKQYVVWLQGESDAINGNDPRAYISEMKTLFAPMVANGIQQIFIITPGNFEAMPGCYDDIIDAQKALCVRDSRFTLATDALHQLPNTYLTDGIHYNQQALNIVGAQAATSAAAYSAVSP